MLSAIRRRVTSDTALSPAAGGAGRVSRSPGRRSVVARRLVSGRVIGIARGLRFFAAAALVFGSCFSAPRVGGSAAFGDDDAVVERGSRQATGPSRGEQRSAPRKKVEDRKSSESRLAKGEINFDDLKFDLEKDAAMDKSRITKTIKKINGKKVKLSGFILPASVFANENIRQFVLVRDNQECCFGPGAALFDCVMVEMQPGHTAEFATRPVTVEGKFELDLEKYAYPGGKGPRGASHYAIFRIKGVKVR